MWQPDGWGWRARIGVLTAHTGVCPESEFAAMAPEGVSVHASRVPFEAAPGGVMDPTLALQSARAFADPPHVDDVAEVLAAAPLSAIAFCFTASSYARGPADDAELKARLEGRTRGIPVAVAVASAAVALRALRARRVALIHPPWFSAELNALGREYFGQQGFEVVHAAPYEAEAAGGPRPVHERVLDPGALYEWARSHVPPSAEAVYIGGNGFRAVGAIDTLEQDLGRPVLTANQAAFWHALRLSGARAPVVGYGQIFGRELPAS
jgi:maleate isomerase